jgi:hypothetical protein
MAFGYFTRAAAPASATDEMLKKIRKERDLANLGKSE